MRKKLLSKIVAMTLSATMIFSCTGFSFAADQNETYTVMDFSNVSFSVKFADEGIDKNTLYSVLDQQDMYSQTTIVSTGKEDKVSRTEVSTFYVSSDNDSEAAMTRIGSSDSGILPLNDGQIVYVWTRTMGSDLKYGYFKTGQFTARKVSGVAEVTVAPTDASPKLGTEDPLITAGTASNGTMVYSLKKYEGYSANIPTAIDRTAKGKVTVYYKAAGGDNYVDSVAGSISVNVVAGQSAVVTKAPEPVSLVENKSYQPLANAGECSGGNMQYSLYENKGFSTTLPVAKAPGIYTVYYKAVGDKTHDDSETGSIESVIIQMEGASVDPQEDDPGMEPENPGDHVELDIYIPLKEIKTVTVDGEEKRVVDGLDVNSAVVDAYGDDYNFLLLSVPENRDFLSIFMYGDDYYCEKTYRLYDILDGHLIIPRYLGTFTLHQEPPAIEKVRNTKTKIVYAHVGKRRVKVRWRSNKKVFDGYEIRLKIKGTDDWTETVLVNKPKAYRKTIKKLERHKKYTVSVRGYKTFNGRKYYGECYKIKTTKRRTR